MERTVDGHSVSGLNPPQQSGRRVSCKAFSMYQCSRRRLLTSRRNTASGREVSGDTSWHRGESFNTGVKKSIFLQDAPENLRTLLQMQSSQFYEEWVAATVQYLQVSTVYDSGFMRSAAHPTTSPGPPESECHGNGCGKTKDKGKGKAMGSPEGVGRSTARRRWRSWA